MRPLSLCGSAVLAVLTAVCLSACGQKGALYLPEQNRAPQPAVVQQPATQQSLTQQGVTP